MKYAVFRQSGVIYVGPEGAYTKNCVQQKRHVFVVGCFLDAYL